MPKQPKAKNHYFYVINIKLRDKNTKADLSVEAYEKLFRRLWRKKIHKESSPNKHCIIKSAREEKEEGKLLFFNGLLAQFTYIGHENWINIDELEEVDDVHLPKNIFPDLVLSEYVFIPSAHRFAFQTSSNISISPYPVKKYLEKAFAEVTEANEIVQVDVETSNDGIKQIFEALEVRRLTLKVNYSNMDFSDDVQEFFEENLRESNTESITITAKAKSGNSIEIKNSPILQGGLETAQSNGEAEARIIDKNGTLRTVKTENYPLKDYVFGVMTSFSDLVYKAIMHRFRKK